MSLESQQYIINCYYNEVDSKVNKKFIKNVLDKIIQKNNIKWTQLNKNKEIVNLVKDNIIYKHKKQIGGTKQSTSGNEDNPKYTIPKQLMLPNSQSIKKICSLNIKNKVAIGEFDYEILKLRSGKYNAYLVDDNLMIINADLKVKPTKKIKEWKWKYSGRGVNVDGGTFGFYDLDSIKKINKILKSNGRMPLFDIDVDKGYTIISGSHVSDLCEDDKKKFSIFGVSATTSIGDGRFECYTIGNDRAVLIGGYTVDELFWS